MQTRQKALTNVQEAYEIGLAAYLYLYPLVTMDITRRQMTNLEAGKREGFGPMNSFTHVRSFPSADFKSVVRPNFDTLYSIAWLDLLREPVVVTVPDTRGRYYELEMLDMWSDAFAVPGKDTTGTEADHFAVVSPDWEGELPSGITRIDAPTNYVWIIGRTQTNGPDDYAAVHEIQDKYTITPLSQWGRELRLVEARIDPTVDMTTPPLDQVNAMSLSDYFAYAVKLMEVHPPHLTDWSILARMKRIGLEPDKSFDLKAQDPEIQRELSWVASDGSQDCPVFQWLAGEHKYDRRLWELLSQACYRRDDGARCEPA